MPQMFSQFCVQIFALYNFFCKNLHKNKAQIFYGSYMPAPSPQCSPHPFPLQRELTGTIELRRIHQAKFIA